MDLRPFAEAVGTSDAVTVSGLGTRGGPVPGVRLVTAPVGIDWIQPAEMTVSVAAGTPVEIQGNASVRQAYLGEI